MDVCAVKDGRFAERYPSGHATLGSLFETEGNEVSPVVKILAGGRTGGSPGGRCVPARSGGRRGRHLAGSKGSPLADMARRGRSRLGGLAHRLRSLAHQARSVDADLRPRHQPAGRHGGARDWPSPICVCRPQPWRARYQADHPSLRHDRRPIQRVRRSAVWSRFLRHPAHRVGTRDSRGRLGPARIQRPRRGTSL